MAKVVEETITIKLSKLVSDKDNNAGGFANQDVVTTLEEAAKELIQDPTLIVEAELGKTASNSSSSSKSRASKSSTEEE